MKDIIRDLDKITLLVTPHDDYRYPCLYRFLEYYSSFNFPFRIIILNSCPSDINKELFNSYLKVDSISHYKFDHSERFEKKLIFGISKVTTQYCIICSEDDFIIPKGIAESINFLEKNGDYSAALGKCYLFSLANSADALNSKNIQYNVTYNSATSIDFDDPGVRLLHYFANYNIPVFFAVYKTNFLKDIWEKTLENTDDYRFGELLPAMLTVIYGKLKILDCLYIAREFISASEGQQIQGYNHFIEAKTFQKKFNKFRKCLSEALENVAGMNSNKAKLIINKGMKLFLGYSWRKYKLKRLFINYADILGFYKILIRLKKLYSPGRIIHLKVEKTDFPYKSMDHPYYLDWEKLDRIIFKNSLNL